MRKNRTSYTAQEKVRMGMRFMKLIWQTRRTQNISSIGLFYNNWEIILGKVSDCEELVETVSGSE